MFRSRQPRYMPAWEKQWARHLTFDQFCEYLLPYKYAEYQRLDYWRDALNKKFYEAVNKVAPNDLDCQFAYRPGTFLNNDFITKIKIKLLLENSKLGLIPVHFNSQTIPRMSFGDCNDYALVNVAMMRSAGVPAVYEYTPQWGERASGRHGWSTVYNNNGFLLTPHIDKELGAVFFPTRKLPKIFRQQYAVVPEREEYVQNAEFVYSDFVQFEKDVTAEYLPTTDLEIPVNTKGLADKYAYIAVSNFRDWNIVDFGIIKGKKAYFKDMGRDIAYLVMGYDGKELVAITDPFILESNGNIRSLKPDKTHLDTLTLWRKYPRNTNTTSMEKRILKGKVQASNDSLFTTSTTFYEVKDLYYPDLIPIASDSAYRFWRYLGAPKSYSNIAEVQFYKDGVDSMLMGKIYGAAGVNHADAFDGDWLTYYRSTNKWAPAWIGMDFGDTVRIDKVRLVPRSDDNGIHYGDTYELNYYADGQWNSRGQQEAKERFLVFDSVPRNSLLLLKNLSRGKEERIFIYENGKQVWW